MNSNTEPIRIGLIGYGKMGKTVETVASRHGMEVAARFMDVVPFRSDASVRKALKGVSLMIDFSVPDAVLDHISLCAEFGLNLVMGTTGWAAQVDRARDLVQKGGIGFLHAANFSLGVNLFYSVVRRAAECFRPFESYDPYIEELHHKFKKDAPSGTAKVLHSILEELYGTRTVPVTNVRAGYIPGTHAVTFDSQIDSVSLVHTARNREGFAEGALLAARWLIGRQGFFEFQDMLDSVVSGTKNSRDTG